MPGSSPLRHLPSSAPQPHASPPSARTLSPAPGTPGGKRHGRRACESCRASKQRCSFLTPEGEDAGTCSHCQKSGAACIVAHPAAKIAGTASQGVGPGHSVPPTPEGANSVLGKRRRACESCRTSKAKCIFEAENDSTCKNCAKAKRTCVVELDGRFPKKVGEGTGDGTEKRRKVEKGDEKTVVMENAGQLDCEIVPYFSLKRTLIYIDKSNRMLIYGSPPGKAVIWRCISISLLSGHQRERGTSKLDGQYESPKPRCH